MRGGEAPGFRRQATGWRLLWIALAAASLGTLYGAQESPQEHIRKLLDGTAGSIAAGELEKAESDAREALGVSLDQLGAIYSALGRPEQAEAAYRQAVRAAPASGSPLMGLAILFLRTGQYDKGIEAAQQILQLNPLHAGARHVLGKIQFMKGDFGEAAGQLRDAYQARPDDISISYTLALAYLKLDQPDKARQVFDEIAQKTGESARLRLLFGRAFRQVNRAEDAIREFERAIQLDSETPRAHYYLGLTYLLQQGQSAFPQAIREFEIELKREPQAYFPNFYLGLIYSQQHENEKAIGCLQKAVQAEPQNPDPYLFLGQAQSQAGDYAAAAEILEKSIALTQDVSRNSFQVANAHYSLGRALLRLGKRDEALSHLDLSRKFKADLSEQEESVVDAIRKGLPVGADPTSEADALASESSAAILLDSPQPDEQQRQVLQNTADFYRQAAGQGYLVLARLATLRSQFENAADRLQRAVEWDAALPDAYFNLGVAHFKAGRPDLAVAPLIQALQNDPSRLEARQLLANLALQLVDRGDQETAQQAVSFLLQANPNVPELHILNGHLAAQRGFFDEAVRHYRRALEISALVPNAHYSAGTALIRQGKLQEALTEFEAELKLNPDHPRALYHKALILITDRDAETAIPILERVVRLESDYGDAYYQLGKAQLQSGKEYLLLPALANLETAAHFEPTASYVFYQLSQAYSRSNRPEDSQKALQRYQMLKRAEEEARLKEMRKN